MMTQWFSPSFGVTCEHAVKAIILLTGLSSVRERPNLSSTFVNTPVDCVSW